MLPSLWIEHTAERSHRRRAAPPRPAPGSGATRCAAGAAVRQPGDLRTLGIHYVSPLPELVAGNPCSARRSRETSPVRVGTTRGEPRVPAMRQRVDAQLGRASSTATPVTAYRRGCSRAKAAIVFNTANTFPERSKPLSARVSAGRRTPWRTGRARRCSCTSPCPRSDDSLGSPLHRPRGRAWSRRHSGGDVNPLSQATPAG